MLWGTDSIWYGSPQDQIDAFRAFQIAPELREKHRYAELTPALKRKVFGLNAVKVYSLDAVALKKYLAGDSVDRARAAYAGAEDPAFATYGPKTARNSGDSAHALAPDTVRDEALRSAGRARRRSQRRSRGH